MDSAHQYMQELAELSSKGLGAVNPQSLARVTDLFILTESQQSESDSDLFGTVLESIAYKADIKDRVLLAERITASAKAPCNLIRRLAVDEIVVARPVLQYSTRLTDEELMALAGKLSQNHLLAISSRHRLSASLTDILIEHGNRSVLCTLERNLGAIFSASGAAHLRKLAETDEDLRRVIDSRSNLRPHFFIRLRKYASRLFKFLFYGVVADADDKSMTIEGYTEEGDDPATTVPGWIEGQDDVPNSWNETNKSHSDFGEDATSSARNAQPSITETPLIENARAGLVAETISSLAGLTKTGDTVAEHCLFKEKPAALVVLCKAHNLSSTALLALLQIRDSISGDKSLDIVSLLRRYESMSVIQAKHIINLSDGPKI